MGANTKGIEAGKAYVTIVAESSGVSRDIEHALTEGGERGGEAAGEAASKGMQDKLKKTSAAIGLAAAGGIAVGMNQAMSSADLEGTLKAQLGTTPQYAAEIAETAGNVFASGWGESLEEVGKSAAVLGQMLNEAGDDSNLEELTKKGIALAQAYDQEAQHIFETAEKMTKNGMAENITDGINMITRGFQSNSELGDDMLDSLSEYGAGFKTMGLDGTEAITMMNQVMDAGGWNGDKVSDGLREFMIRAQENAEATGEAFESIGLDGAAMQDAVAAGGDGAKQALQSTLDGLRAMTDPAERAVAAAALFGPVAEEMQGSLFAMDPSAAVEGFKDLDGAASDFVADSEGFGTQSLALGRSLSMGLGEALTPLLPQMAALADVGLTFFRWLGENPVITQILLGLGVAIGALAAAQWIWNAAQAASPAIWIMMLIAAAIAVVIAVVWLLWDNWDTVMEYVHAAGKGLEIGLTHVWNGIKHGVNGVIHAINWLGRAIESVLSLGGLLGDWGWGEIPLLEMTEVPGLQTGGTVTRPGTTLVGEAGPELLQLPRGASVIPLDHPAAGVGSRGGSSKTVNMHVVNPTAEKTSVTVRKASQLLGASLGV